MRSQNYLFPGCPIIQDDAYFKLSQDSVLLGAFARVKARERVLDLGCGVGVLTLIAALRQPLARCTGIEITVGAAELARENIRLNGLEERCEIIEGDIRELPTELLGRFDICISNPPYFDPAQGLSSPSPAMAAARNEASGSIGDFCRAASKALKWGGRFCLCFPPGRMAALFAALSENGLEPKVMTLVYPAENREPCLALIRAKKGGGAGLRVTKPLFITLGGAETDEFRSKYILEDKNER